MSMLRRSIISFCFSLCFTLMVQAQSDSLQMPLDRLGMQDLLLGDSILISTQVSAASKSLQKYF